MGYCDWVLKQEDVKGSMLEFQAFLKGSTKQQNVSGGTSCAEVDRKEKIKLLEKEKKKEEKEFEKAKKLKEKELEKVHIYIYIYI